MLIMLTYTFLHVYMKRSLLVSTIIIWIKKPVRYVLVI